MASARNHSHPYRRDDKGDHAHFRPTPLNYPAYSAPGVPFRWMLKESFSGNVSSGLREHYPLDDVREDVEPNIDSLVKSHGCHGRGYWK